MYDYKAIGFDVVPEYLVKSDVPESIIPMDLDAKEGMPNSTKAEVLVSFINANKEMVVETGAM